MASLDWDIFCRVIDNHGDIGVCWRLSRQLAQRGHRVRLWVDDASALAWMAPGRANLADGVDVRAWVAGESPGPGTTPAAAVIEAFGCELDDTFVAAMARRAAAGHPSVWINLEYLSAEAWVERNHGLPSPVLAGPGAGLEKIFFYPGFTSGTGGLLREPGLMAQRCAFERSRWLHDHGIAAAAPSLVASLFCYEPPALPTLLAQLPSGTELLVTPGRATAAAQAAQHAGTSSDARISWLAAVPQPQFDELLWASDLNFVRGEDSLVRALWAGVPFVWQIYPQHDDAHHAKLNAFLDWLQAPATLRSFSHAWNAIPGPALVMPDTKVLAEWGDCALAARERLLAQPDLCSQLEALQQAHDPIGKAEPPH